MPHQHPRCEDGYANCYVVNHTHKIFGFVSPYIIIVVRCLNCYILRRKKCKKQRLIEKGGWWYFTVCSLRIRSIPPSLRYGATLLYVYFAILILWLILFLILTIHFLYGFFIPLYSSKRCKLGCTLPHRHPWVILWLVMCQINDIVVFSHNRKNRSHVTISEGDPQWCDSPFFLYIIRWNLFFLIILWD